MAIETFIDSDHTNSDALTGEPASHPGATGIGAAAGAATGAAAGAMGGPIGVVVGAVAGGIVGGLMGHDIGEWHDPSDEIYWRQEYKTSSFYDETADFDRDVAPALQCGGLLAVRMRQNPSQKATHLAESFAAMEAEATEQWELARGKSKYTFAEASKAIEQAYLKKLHHQEDVMQGVAVFKDE
jgi:hypothetical protein